MTTVVLVGATGVLGRRVSALLAADADVERVVGAAAGAADLKGSAHGADVLLHLACSPASCSHDASDVVDQARRSLDAAAGAGVGHVVLLSNATVYGAWSNNPVPLTEEAPLRPNPGVAFAAQMAEVERLAAEWRDDHPGTTLALLRPTVTVAEGSDDWLARAARGSGAITADEQPPAQFLHVDDLAAAVDTARRERLDGPHNVAPDGWISGETVRTLAGGAPRLRLPERLATRVATLRWRWGLAPTPPELLPYSTHPWVVANDRLRSAGWEPRLTNEEAYVTANEAGPWATLSPRRRQEIALAATGVAIAGVLVGAVALVRRRTRRRS